MGSFIQSNLFSILLTKGKGGVILIYRLTIGGYSMEQERKDVLLRLRRIEGQIRGLQRLVEEEVPCADILTQVAAVTAAIKKVGTVVVKTYMEECLDKTQREPGWQKTETLRDFQRRFQDILIQLRNAPALTSSPLGEAEAGNSDCGIHKANKGLIIMHK